MLPRDLATAQPMPLGRVVRTLTEPFIPGGALPSWLEASQGTASYQAPTDGAGYVRVTSGANMSDPAELRTTFDIDITNYDEVRFTLEGLVFSDTTGADLVFGIDNNSSKYGVAYSDTSSGGQVLRAREASSDDTETVNYQVRADATHRRNLTLVCQPKRQAMYLMEDDQVVGYREGLAMNFGDCRARITIANTTAAARWFQVSQVKLTLVHN